MTESTEDRTEPALEPGRDAARDGAEADEPATTEESVGDDAATDDTSDPARRARAEAKNLRARVRALEQERDTLARAVEHYRRADVEQHAAAAGLAAPSDLWLAPEVQLEQLVGDDGAVDPAKVQQAVAQVLEARPHWRRAGPRPDRSQGSTSHDGVGGAGRSWETLIRSR